MGSEVERGLLRRREFLAGGIVATLGLGALPLGRGGASDDSVVRRYPSLGKTGLTMSDISFGSSRLSGDPDLVRYAFDRGIRYFDSAESYKGGRSETTLGKALRGNRDQVVLTSKVQARARDRRDGLMRALEGSLRRLQTDTIDIYFNHAVNDVARLKNPEWYEFAERAKKQGKIRFTGMSGHGGRLIECLDFALDRDLVDVVLVAYNFGQDPAFYEGLLSRFDFVAIQPDLPRVLAKAHEKGVGVVAMKTLMGARLNDMRPYESGGTTFAQSAFQWVLSDPHVDGLIVSMTSREGIGEYLGASGRARGGSGQRRLLERYVELQGSSYCRHGCNACIESCPAGVPIAEVLRTRMYATDYGDRDLARSEYAKLGAGAAACIGCLHRACLSACPYGLEIPERTSSAHRMLRG